VSLKIDSKFVKRIQDEYFYSRKPADIATHLHLHVCRKTVYNLCNNLHDFRALYLTICFKKRGGPRKLTASMKHDLFKLLTMQSTYYLDELQFYLLEEHEVWVSGFTVSRMIKRGDFTQKVTQCIAAQ